MSSTKTIFNDSGHTTVEFNSCWRVTAAAVSIECQTTPELYQFEDAETQSGFKTNVVLSEVSSKFAGKSLVSFLSKTKKQATAEEWADRISKGSFIQ